MLYSNFSNKTATYLSETIHFLKLNDNPISNINDVDNPSWSVLENGIVTYTHFEKALKVENLICSYI
jgi:hypothetical protein